MKEVRVRVRERQRHRDTETERQRDRGRKMFSLSQKKPLGLSSAKPTSYILGNCNSDNLNDSPEFKQLVNGKNIKGYWESSIFQLIRSTDFLTNNHPCILDARYESCSACEVMSQVSAVKPSRETVVAMRTPPGRPTKAHLWMPSSQWTPTCTTTQRNWKVRVTDTVRARAQLLPTTSHSQSFWKARQPQRLSIQYSTWT